MAKPSIQGVLYCDTRNNWILPLRVRMTRAQKKRDSAFAKSLFLRVPGLEPGAFWFVAKRSIQLGYIRVLSSFVDVPKYRIIENNVKGWRPKKRKKVFECENFAGSVPFPLMQALFPPYRLI